MPDWINAANAVLVTSDNEGFGLIAVEALACDVAIVSTPVGIAPLLLDGVAGCAAMPFDPEAWSELLDSAPRRPGFAGRRPGPGGVVLGRAARGAGPRRLPGGARACAARDGGRRARLIFRRVPADGQTPIWNLQEGRRRAGGLVGGHGGGGAVRGGRGGRRRPDLRVDPATERRDTPGETADGRAVDGALRPRGRRRRRAERREPRDGDESEPTEPAGRGRRSPSAEESDTSEQEAAPGAEGQRSRDPASPAPEAASAAGRAARRRPRGRRR